VGFGDVAGRPAGTRFEPEDVLPAEKRRRLEAAEGPPAPDGLEQRVVERDRDPELLGAVGDGVPALGQVVDVRQVVNACIPRGDVPHVDAALGLGPVEGLAPSQR